jgi:hypothetical protein
MHKNVYIIYGSIIILDFKSSFWSSKTKASFYLLFILYRQIMKALNCIVSSQEQNFTCFQNELKIISVAWNEPYSSFY